ncbi:hypothetical protein T11_9117 [Trichinella zimbabwensis]|uniref:Uncharacterized protein n=1 Tax=Trichinella zimbabwensis TaxID=268475 RepID=A0A0V1GX60_9BILA|nr:hypothetical protein T11_9117 [Trichinella zimbabwensis]
MFSIRATTNDTEIIKSRFCKKFSNFCGALVCMQKTGASYHKRHHIPTLAQFRITNLVLKCHEDNS